MFPCLSVATMADAEKARFSRMYMDMKKKAEADIAKGKSPEDSLVGYTFKQREMLFRMGYDSALLDEKFESKEALNKHVSNYKNAALSWQAQNPGQNLAKGEYEHGALHSFLPVS